MSMTRTRHVWMSALLFAGIGLSSPVLAQGGCLNETLYPAGAITPSNIGLVTVIATCNFRQEHSQITGIVPGGTYEFTSSLGSYVTLRSGSYDGGVVAEGTAPLQYVAADNSDLFPHWNVDDACTTDDTECVETNVQRILNCTPPEFTYTYTEDCDLGEFYLDIDVTSTGDGSTVNITYDVFGSIQTIPGVGVGLTQIGPFFIGDQVDLTIEHESDPECNIALGLLELASSCPVPIGCGGPAIVNNYCYTDLDSRTWTYQAAGSGSLILYFTQGTIETCCDDLAIYDGLDATGTLLYQFDGLSADISDISVISTTGSLHMVMSSDGSVSCTSQSTTEWIWEVNCLNCAYPQVATNVVEDCPNNQWTLEVDVLSTGDGSTVNLDYNVNGGGVQSEIGVGVGVTILGPFAIGDVVDVTVVHESDAICNLALPTITDPGNCPTIIECGVPPITETYCYGPSDAQEWRYESSGAGTLRLRFLRGTIESNNYDSLEIYDGPDATAPLLFTHNNTLTYNLGPVGSAVNNLEPNFYEVIAYSTSGQLYMEMTSDGSVQCGGEFPTATYDSWEWEVVCLDCSIPTGDVTIVDDCANNQFSLDVNVTGTGDATTARILYTINGGDVIEVTGLAVGVTTIGPFGFDDIVNVTIAHESNDLCNIGYGNFSDTGTCPLLIACDGTFVQDSVCFANNQDLRYYYQGTGTFPLGIFFDNGTLGFGDVLTLYDGGDITAPVLQTFNATPDLAGVFVSTTNPEHRLTLRIQANGFTSCGDGGLIDDIGWQVGCLDCVPPTGTFTIVQDCDNFQYFIDVNVTSLGTDPELEIANDGGVASTNITTPGTYQIGPFVSGTPIEVTLVNDANSLCNVYSGTLVNPLCPTVLCGSTPFVETYCYTNSENRAWAYEVPAGGTIRLVFQRGTIESNTWDDLIIFDGPDPNSDTLFIHNNTLTYNLGPDGSAVNSTASPYYTVDVTTTGTNLYMTLTTDASVSCESQAGAWDSWEWTAQCFGCQAPGVAYNLVPNCFDRTYTAEVIVTQTPGPDGLEIVNELTSEQQLATAPGVYTFGPYDQNNLTIFGVTDLADATCTFMSDSLTYASTDCILSTCQVVNTELCYGNDLDRWYTYQANENVPISIAFLQGQLLSGDQIVVYNGADETANVIYQGANGGNMAGFAVNSQNPENIITLRIRSNAAGSCDDGAALTPLKWDVGCGFVGISEGEGSGFNVYPNPTRDLITVGLGSDVSGDVLIRVMDISGRVVMEHPYVAKGGGNQTLDLKGLQSGQYLVQLNTSEWVRTQRVELTR